jgi:hypothetical protein
VGYKSATRLAQRENQGLNFSPVSARKGNQPYPPALLNLGCLIWKLRNDVFGDEAYGDEPFYRQDDCKSVLEIQ